MQYKYEMNASDSLAIPSMLSCNKSRSSTSDVTEFINDFSESAETVDFVVSLSIS
jgi:hypothetical protein